MICIIRTGMPDEAVPWLGCILAGGEGKRLGSRCKALVPVDGRPLLDHVIERALPQVAGLALNANDDPANFSNYGLPIVPDPSSERLGPLAGVLAAMDWAAADSRSTGWVATFPVDSPFFPTDLVRRLSRAISDAGADIGRAMSNGHPHPVFALWPIRLRHDLRAALLEEGVRGVDYWMRRYNVVQVDFAAQRDPFFDVDTPDDLAAAEIMMREG